jgi:hypothetical protein
VIHAGKAARSTGKVPVDIPFPVRLQFANQCSFVGFRTLQTFSDAVPESHGRECGSISVLVVPNPSNTNFRPILLAQCIPASMCFDPKRVIFVLLFFGFIVHGHSLENRGEKYPPIHFRPGSHKLYS